jgi:hypothetical protein
MAIAAIQGWMLRSKLHVFQMVDELAQRYRAITSE